MKGNGKKNVSWLVAGASISLLVWAVVLGWRLVRPKVSYLELGRQMSAAVHSRDSKRVYQLMNPVERSVAGVTLAGVDKLIELALPKDFSEWSLIDEGYTTSMTGDVNLRTVFQSKSGRRATLDIVVTNSEDGPGPFVVIPIVYLGAQAANDAGGLDQQSAASWLRTNASELEREGVKGAVSSQNGRLATWPSVIAFLERVAARQAASRKAK